MESVAIEVRGMHCKSCELNVIDEVSEIEGVADVSASADAGTVTITGSALDRAELRAAIARAGYEASD